MIAGGPLPSPIGATSDTGDAFVDWAADIDPISDRQYYALEIDDGILDAIRIPISSWQATVQLGRQSFALAVIPAAGQWVDAIEARADGEFIIYRGVEFFDGSVEESELARAPLQTITLDTGPTNQTMRISGYATLAPPADTLTRTLQNVRSESVTSGLRVRCDIDFFLRPGYTATSRGQSFQVSYINYYANASEEYMDVGERTL